MERGNSRGNLGNILLSLRGTQCHGNLGEAQDVEIASRSVYPERDSSVASLPQNDKANGSG